MDKITWSNLIALGSVLIGYLIMGITAFVKLNIKNTENAKDILALRNEFNEHKQTNREDFEELKDIIRQGEEVNRKDHREIMTEISKLTITVSQMRGELNQSHK